MSAVDAPIYVSADVKSLIGKVYPFVAGSYLNVHSVAGTTLYSAQQASRTTSNYQKFAGDGLTKAFPVTAFSAANTSGGAVSAANQLLTVATIDGTPKLRTRGDAAVGAAGNFVCAPGGGTAGGQADLTLKATTAVAVGANSIFVKEASGTGTVVIGDQITIAGDDTVYTMTAATATLDGTGVELAITPPIKVPVASGDSTTTAVTIAAPAKPVAIFYTAPAEDVVIEVFLHTAGEITTVTGGALTAGRVYKEKLGEFVHSAGNLDLIAP
jgi:hypothetical protein